MSHRDILRASSIIGVASATTVLAGLVRMKVAALLLGTAGVGLIGLLQNLMTTAATFGGLGLGTAGTRAVAEAKANGGAEIAVVRRALLLGSLLLAVVSAAAFWLLRRPLAVFILEDAAEADRVGLLAIGVALTIVAASQTALFTGLRRLGDLARVSIISAALGSLGAVAAVMWLGMTGIVAFIVVVPATLVGVGAVFAMRIDRAAKVPTPLSVLTPQWRALIGIGVALTIAGVAALLGQLAIRILIQRSLGVSAVGLFQASWVISATYIGFALQTMGTDYYPRLSQTFSTGGDVERVVNDQSEIALLLAGPVLLATIGIAPYLLQLLYSRSFVDAAPFLRLQSVGDLLKVASWPFSYCLLAAGRGRTFMFGELAAMAVFVGVSAFAIPHLGLTGVGVAYVVMYALYLPTSFLLARRGRRFRWEAAGMARFTGLVIAALTILAAATQDDRLGAAVGLGLAAVFGISALSRIGKVMRAT